MDDQMVVEIHISAETPGVTRLPQIPRNLAAADQIQVWLSGHITHVMTSGLVALRRHIVDVNADAELLLVADHLAGIYTADFCKAIHFHQWDRVYIVGATTGNPAFWAHHIDPHRYGVAIREWIRRDTMNSYREQ